MIQSTRILWFCGSARQQSASELTVQVWGDGGSLGSLSLLAPGSDTHRFHPLSLPRVSILALPKCKKLGIATIWEDPGRRSIRATRWTKHYLCHIHTRTPRMQESSGTGHLSATDVLQCSIDALSNRWCMLPLLWLLS